MPAFQSRERDEMPAAESQLPTFEPQSAIQNLQSTSVPPPSRDTLYAIQTPTGEGAIATFVLDGDGCFAALQKTLRTKESLHGSGKGHLFLGRIVDGSGRLVDEAVVAPIDPKQSPSAMERVELSCHGGTGAVAAVVQALEQAGFRPGWIGELEARAHRAARLSLPAIEAQFRLASNATARQAEFLLGHNAMRERWERIGMNAALGARQRTAGWRADLRPHIEDELAGAEAGLRLVQTHHVVVTGPVNAGKSTLVNALLRSEQSIVSKTPGTTRDHLVRPAHLRGLSVLLSDTAGLRELDGQDTTDDVERRGQERAREAAKQADLVLYLLDGSRPPTETECDDVEAIKQNGTPPILVLNKSDLGTDAEAEGLAFALGVPGVAVSALVGEGLEKLETTLERALLQGDAPEPGTIFTRRQKRCVEALQSGLEEVLDAVQLIGHIRALVGTRPNEVELAKVFREAAEC